MQLKKWQVTIQDPAIPIFKGMQKFGSLFMVLLFLLFVFSIFYYLLKFSTLAQTIKNTIVWFLYSFVYFLPIVFYSVKKLELKYYLDILKVLNNKVEELRLEKAVVSLLKKEALQQETRVSSVIDSFIDIMPFGTEIFEIKIFEG